MTKLNSTACTLLGFLHDRPMTGWDLAETVQLTVGAFWNMSRSQVYRELKTLEHGGFVVGGDRGARDKRHYTITEDGRAAFKDWISQEPGVEIARYPMLITIWFGDHLDQDDLGWSMSVHYARHRKRLEFYDKVYSETQDHSQPASRALRFGMMYEQMVVDWFETLPWFGGVEPTGLEPGESRPSRPRKPSDYGGSSVSIPAPATAPPTERAGQPPEDAPDTGDEVEASQRSEGVTRSKAKPRARKPAKRTDPKAS